VSFDVDEARTVLAVTIKWGVKEGEIRFRPFGQSKKIQLSGGGSGS
jgi:hypothetical protein